MCSQKNIKFINLYKEAFILSNYNISVEKYQLYGI